MRKSSLSAAIIAGLAGVGQMFDGLSGMHRPKYPVPERPVYRSANGSQRNRSAPEWVQLDRMDDAANKRMRRMARNRRLMGVA